MSFWRELSRRNVYKVGAAYALVAFIIAQVVSLIDVPLNLPEWFDTTVLVLLGIAFPLALLFAWAYELTSEGLKQTREVPEEESITHLTSQRLLVGLVIGAGLGSSSVWLLGINSDEEWLLTEAIP